MSRLDYGAGLVSQFGNNAFNTGMNLFGQSMLDSGRRMDNLAARMSALMEAEKQRRFIAQENEKNRDAQEKAQKKASNDSWMKLGVSTAVPVLAGGIAGGISDAAQVPTTVGAGAGETINPSSIQAMQEAGAGPMASGVPFTGSVGIPDPRMTSGNMFSAPVTMGGGSFGRGAALGALGGLTGQDYLTPLQNAPYRNALAAARIYETNMGGYENALQASAAGNRAAQIAALTQPRVDTEKARARSENATAGLKERQTKRIDEMLPLDQALRNADIDLKGAQAGAADATAIDRLSGGGPTKTSPSQTGVSGRFTPDGEPIPFLGRDSKSLAMMALLESGEVPMTEAIRRMNQVSLNQADGRPQTTQPATSYSIGRDDELRGNIRVPPNADPAVVKAAIASVRGVVNPPAPEPKRSAGYQDAIMRMRNIVNETPDKASSDQKVSALLDYMSKNKTLTEAEKDELRKLYFNQ